MDLLEVYLEWMNYKFLRLDGATITEDRAEYLELFNAKVSSSSYNKLDQQFSDAFSTAGFSVLYFLAFDEGWRHGSKSANGRHRYYV